jgi:hypothetical protein
MLRPICQNHCNFGEYVGVIRSFDQFSCNVLQKILRRVDGEEPYPKKNGIC